jgi:hypothetical protein
MQFMRLGYEIELTSNQNYKQEDKIGGKKKASADHKGLGL